MSRSGQDLRRGGRTPGAEGFITADKNALLVCIEPVLPTGANEWERVLAKYRETYAEVNSRALRDATSIKGKYRQLLNSHKPTGDSSCPLEVKKAHIIMRLIQEKVTFRAFDDGAAPDDSSDDYSAQGDSNGLHREAKSIQQFQSSRIASLEQEVFSLKNEIFSLRDDLRYSQKLLENIKDKNYTLREEALQSKADIMDYRAEIAV
ncbi:hypothetical protein BBJ28_00014627 [Nothophytophthora sp. Chile5]|nr:hypothetical protein BBJ28_00014627 [Nothophytophthora sp. Chile5]